MYDIKRSKLYTLEYKKMICFFNFYPRYQNLVHYAFIRRCAGAARAVVTLQERPVIHLSPSSTLAECVRVRPSLFRRRELQ